VTRSGGFNATFSRQSARLAPKAFSGKSGYNDCRFTFWNMSEQPVKRNAMEESICPACLYKNRVTSKFCQSCGKPLWLRDRYLLQAVVEQNSNQAVYAALDKSRCGSPGCGAWIEDTAIPNCPNCESSPYPWSPCEIYQRSAPPSPQQAELEIMGYWVL
jgi:hypothetical protein